jgi:hypothetical protein
MNPKFLGEAARVGGEAGLAERAMNIKVNIRFCWQNGAIGLRGQKFAGVPHLETPSSSKCLWANMTQIKVRASCKRISKFGYAL